MSEKQLEAHTSLRVSMERLTSLLAAKLYFVFPIHRGRNPPVRSTLLSLNQTTLKEFKVVTNH